MSATATVTVEQVKQFIITSRQKQTGSKPQDVAEHFGLPIPDAMELRSAAVRELLQEDFAAEAAKTAPQPKAEQEQPAKEPETLQTEPEAEVAAPVSEVRDDPFSITPEEAKEFAAKNAAEDEMRAEIDMLECTNAELQEAIDSDIILPLVPDGPLEEKLAALRKVNEVLVETINAQDEAPEPVEPEAPKFGKGLAVSLRFKLNGETVSPWVDETGTDIDTGEKYNLSPELQEQLKKQIDERRAEKANEFIQVFDREKENHSYYAMTQEEYELESEKEYPVYTLPQQPGPAWDDSILYGSAGKVIRKAAKYNESHPAGMLVDFLVSLGSVIGRGPYFTISATRHYTNEFMVRVGDSSRARKGTGRDATDELLKLIDYGWFSDRIASGFGYGEAIINRVRDASLEMRQSRTGGFTEVTVPGTTDKRLCIREGEIASVFLLANKPESRASVILRDGWDGKALRNEVKGKSRDGFSNSAKCEEPHVSISGDTTVEELRKTMPQGAEDNGFGNRFLYVYVYRVKDCPQGSPPLDWAQEILEFQQIVQVAKTRKHISMTNQARKWWNNNYSKLEHDGPDGLAGKMTRRAAAHIRRIAMLYALIYLSDEIGLEHFHAAKKLWDYCEESAMFIFGGMTKEQIRIVQWINQRGPSTYKQVRDDLYQRHKPAAAIRADLAALAKSGHLFVNGELYATGQHVGKLIARIEGLIT